MQLITSQVPDSLIISSTKTIIINLNQHKHEILKNLKKYYLSDDIKKQFGIKNDETINTLKNMTYYDLLSFILIVACPFAINKSKKIILLSILFDVIFSTPGLYEDIYNNHKLLYKSIHKKLIDLKDEYKIFNKYLNMHDEIIHSLKNKRYCDSYLIKNESIVVIEI
jgi:hypothetical protein